MADNLTPAQRSHTMASVKSGNTTPELIVRRTLHRLGYRFRLHRRDLPGSPDIVLARYQLAVFVHGCFWHRHSGCERATTPRANAAYWKRKFDRNVQRDRQTARQLRQLGWRVVKIWECEINDVTRLGRKLEKYLK